MIMPYDTPRNRTWVIHERAEVAKHGQVYHLYFAEEKVQKCMRKCFKVCINYVNLLNHA